VVTGLSAVTPLGNDLTTSWDNLLACKSGIGPITAFDCSEYDARIAGEVRDFDPVQFMPAKQAKRMDRFCLFAVAAASMLLKQANFAVDPARADRVGVNVGVGLGGIHTIETYHTKLMQAGPSRMSPFFIPLLIANMAAGQVSIATGAKGPNLCTTTACASGTHAIGYAYTDIALSRADAMICGGAEGTISPLGLSGFTAAKALSTRNDDPERASRPFDKDRDGFVMGEGSGLLLLESLDHARERGATIYAEVVGLGASSDAYHMTSPPEDASGMFLAMRNAVREAGIDPSEVDHINAHGTSTYLNDMCETKAIKDLFGSHAKNIAISANKSQMGHLLGAAGGVESVFSVLSLYHGIVPATINYQTPDPVCDLDYTPNAPRKRDIRYALCNSFGFGGTNACVLYKRFEE
jgi:3-oxoacyl-[acyl-carrier-protein] synthase II